MCTNNHVPSYDFYIGGKLRATIAPDGSAWLWEGKTGKGITLGKPGTPMSQLVTACKKELERDHTN